MTRRHVRHFSRGRPGCGVARRRSAGAVLLAALLAASPIPARARESAGGGPRPSAPLLQEGVQDSSLSDLSRHWELDARAKQGTFLFRPHRPTYVLFARYSSDPNDSPSSPTRGVAPQVKYDRLEAKFQLSFKLKLAQGIIARRVDLWFAYTQQSNWQVYNGAISRPFRETDHEPELMAVVPVRCGVGPLDLRFLNVGLVHQSNGQSEPLSRSWNRAYLQAGLERGRFALLARSWYRFPESRDKDDNDDIGNYVGRGDLLAIQKWRGHSVAVLARNSLTTRNNRGSLQLDWRFPVRGRLRGYVQGFTGYGESMIDYNHKQTTVGLGITLTDWM